MAKPKQPAFGPDHPAHDTRCTGQYCVAADGGRQAFIDACIILLHARGWPQETMFERAEQLWAKRQEHAAK